MERERPLAVPTFVVLLRGINLGSHNKVPMPALRTLVESLGYEEVTTYIQSGNLILSTKDTAAKVSSAVHDAIAGEFGFDVPAVVRTRQQLRKVLDGNPFLKKDRPVSAAPAQAGEYPVRRLKPVPDDAGDSHDSGEHT